MPKSEFQEQSKENRMRRQQSQPDIAAPEITPVDGATISRGLAQPQRLTPGAVMYLQRTIGNRAVAQLLDRGPRIQRSLKVGPADDKYEREADEIAQRVMRSPAPNVKTSNNAKSASGMKPPKDQLQRTAVVGMEGGDISGDLESRIRRSQSGGSPMPNSIRSQLEPKIGADFSNVKVHTGSDAVQLNRELGAKAFTHGNHIYYGAGQSPSNLKLTAHEAVHVVQQGAAGQLNRKPDEESK
jgi:hypothetical protein